MLPKLLLLDEPSEGTGSRARRAGLEFSLALADRVYVLEKEDTGTPMQLREDAELRNRLFAP